MAAKNGEDDVAKFLLKHMTKKMPQDAKGWTPLHYSTHFGKANMTKILLDATENSSSVITQHAFKEGNFFTPIHEAARFGHKAIVQIFLDRLRCETYVFLLAPSKQEKSIISLSQFVYFLREVCLLFIF